ncbi:GerAB/ArcD/ProY family transporter [Paludifilum halophilum]|uniref:Uncharacterized protein n=1 Tax=Paludifilum halophilum TaxID=1642702 RepID=A0A235B202_9BACL|nr:GerAB/ArcD/ProY family transporter [Paludifilum halophilum]OYD06272.1 hypothetical protein CHM34_17055 [Paludifilum halophilum]
MESAKITPMQWFCLIFLFELGSSIVVGLGLEAKQDAWIAILLAMIGGLILYGVFGSLHRHYPDLTLTGYIRCILGNILGWPLGLVYIVYFIYIGSRVLRDISTLLTTAWLDRTPLVVIHMMLILSMAYILYHGPKVLAKTNQIYFYVYVFSLLLSIALIVASGLIRLDFLLPVGEDWGLILSTAYPMVYTFPFGETIVFTMMLPYLKNPRSGLKIGWLAIIISGLFISLLSAIDISVTGAHIASRSPFPLMSTMTKVNIKDFIQRVDMLTIMILVIGGFFKIVIFYFAAVLGTADLFRIKDRGRLLLPIGIIFVFLAMMISSSLSEHLKQGLEIVPRYLHLPLQTGIPLLLLGVSWIKRRMGRSQHPRP